MEEGDEGRMREGGGEGMEEGGEMEEGGGMEEGGVQNCVSKIQFVTGKSKKVVIQAVWLRTQAGIGLTSHTTQIDSVVSNLP